MDQPGVVGGEGGAVMGGNGTLPTPGDPQWGSTPAWKMPKWFEPVAIVIVLLVGIWMNRRKTFSLLHDRSTIKSERPLLPSVSTSISDFSTLDDEEEEYKPIDTRPASGKKERRVLGMVFHTPDNNQFANNFVSRFFFKFPFLVEVLYWSVTYAVYKLSHDICQAVFTDSIWDVAQANAIRVLDFEQKSIFSFLFPIRELDFQRWFIGAPGEVAPHSSLLTALNRFYALVHIPGTVYFIGWFYSVAPSHAVFAIVRRTLTLTNWLAFFIFTVYPCMPPRLLPKTYGFVDTVRREQAESVFMKGRFVNALAAMPSMHFGYSFVVGCTMVWHSHVLQSLLRGKRTGKLSRPWMAWFFLAGGLYPTLILITIVATANHYWLDAVAGGLCAVVALACNRVYLVATPLEDWFCRLVRVKKPRSNAGRRE